MPISFYSDDVVVTGDLPISLEMIYQAKMLAIMELNLEYDITGNPPMPTPVSASPLQMVNYMGAINRWLSRLHEAMENATQNQ